MYKGTRVVAGSPGVDCWREKFAQTGTISGLGVVVVEEVVVEVVLEDGVGGEDSYDGG